MSSFAVFGFLLGTITYFVFNWFATNGIVYVASVPISEIILSPWFISGIVGSLISIAVIYLYAHFAGQE